MVATAFHVEKLGYSNANELFRDLVLELVGEGTNVAAEAKKFDFVTEGNINSAIDLNAEVDGSVPGDELFVVLKATSQVDVNIIDIGDVGDLIWGVSVLVTDAQQVKMSWGRIRRDGGNAEVPNKGEMDNVAFASAFVRFNLATLSAAKVDNGSYTQNINPSNPHGFDLVTADRGFALGLFHQTKVKGWKQFGSLCIQRPVDNEGNIPLTGKQPIFAIWNDLDYGKITGTPENPDEAYDPRWYCSVVQENDISISVGSDIFHSKADILGTAYPRIDMRPVQFRQIHFENIHTLYRFPTDWDIPITQDNNEVPLVFPFGLATSRFAYLENMDLICVGPACVFTFGQDIDITVFQGQARVYRIFSSSDPCRGVVFSLLKDGPEFV